MEPSVVRKRILDVITAARRDAAERRKRNADADAAFETFLDSVAAPVCRQVAEVLKAERIPFAVHTPAGAVRLVSERSKDDFLEVHLDTAAARPQVVVHVERAKGRERFVDELPIRAGVTVEHLSEADVLDAVADALAAIVDR